jgi:preprotein translocase subunit SecG
MEFWTNIMIVVHVLIALAIIGLVLLQHGKGADMGSGFGGGSSSSLFGATGSANFLSRATAALATVFFLLSLALAYLATNQPRESGSVVDRVRQKPAAEKQLEKPSAVPQSETAPAPQKKSDPVPPPASGGRQVPQ